MQRKNVMDDLLTNELRDLYSAENQLIEVLPKLAEATNDENLKIFFLTHQHETIRHKERLDQISKITGKDIGGIHCAIIKDLISEAEEIIHAYEDTFLLNPALISIALRTVHYQIASYGASLNYADLIIEDEVASILLSSLREKKEADILLNKLANVSLKTEKEEAI